MMQRVSTSLRAKRSNPESWAGLWIASSLRSSQRRCALLPTRHQRGVAAGGGGVYRYRLLGREPRQIMRTRGLGARAGKAVAAERLHADHGADHVAVDVDVADGEP